MPRLIAVDWGTSSLRGALLDEAGRVLEEKSAPLGILNVPNGDFAGVFAEQFSDWVKSGGAPCLISGMAGSRQGWVEAPYVACPAGPAELAQHLRWIERGRIAIVPGLSDTQGDVPDVMRGEEVQIFGAMRLAGLADGLFVHTAKVDTPFETDVTLPNISCRRCTLQVIQFMEQHGVNNPGMFTYHHCAALQITADPKKPIAADWPKERS